MKKLLSVLILLSSLAASAQDAGDGSGRIDIYGTSPLTVLRADTNSVAIASIANVRGSIFLPINKTIFITDSGRQGFFVPASSAHADDSVFYIHDGLGRTLQRFSVDGKIRAEWFFGTSKDVTIPMQRIMNYLPSGAILTITDSADYSISAMITRSKPITIQVGPKVTFRQATDYTSMFYFNTDSVNWDGGWFYQTGKGDENDFPRGYGSAFVFQDVQGTCNVTHAHIFNCGDYLHQGISSPRSATGQPYAGSGKLTSSAGIYVTRSGYININHNWIYRSITAINTDGYQNKNIGTPGHMVITDNDIENNYIEDCTQGVVIDGLDSAGLADAFPGWVMYNTFYKTPAFTATATPNTSAIKVFTNLATKGIIVQYNHIKGRYGAAISIQTGTYNGDFGFNVIDSAFDAYASITGGRVVRYLNIHDNHITASAHADYNIIGAQQSKFVNNQSLNSRGYGFIMDGFVNDINMVDNTVINPAKNGVLLVSGTGIDIGGGSMINWGTDGLNDSAAVSMNYAAGSGVLFNVNVHNVKFDVPGTAGTPALTGNKYALYAHGAYSASNSFTWAGTFHHNFIGRMKIADDQTEHSFGMVSRFNQGPNAYDTVTGNILQIRWDQNTQASIANSTTGAMAWTATGSAPALSLGFPTSINSLFTASGGFTSNATVANANFAYGGSTGVTGSTSIRDTAALQGTIAYHLRTGGSASLVATGTLIGGNVVNSRTDFTANGTSYIGFNQLDLPMTLNVASTGTVQYFANHWIYGRSTGATLGNFGMYFDRTAIGYRSATPYGQSKLLFAIGNDGTQDSVQITVDNLNNLPRQQVTAGTATTPARANILITFNPASTLASHVLTMPAAPFDQQVVQVEAGGTITSGAVITAFTVSPNTGQRIIQSTTVTTLAAGDFLQWAYNTTLAAWFRRH
jgi:hypothetical protein